MKYENKFVQININDNGEVTIKHIATNKITHIKCSQTSGIKILTNGDTKKIVSPFPKPSALLIS